MVSLIALNACGNIDKEKLGLTRKAPNENLVKVRPPLSLPPEYDYSPAKQAQKNMFKAPQASYTVLQQPVSLEPEKAEPEEAHIPAISKNKKTNECGNNTFQGI